MSALVPAQELPEADPIAVLEGIDRRLAGITASLDGIAIRQQALDQRNYAPQLDAQTQEMGRLTDKVTILARSPALELTPQRVQGAIELAVRTGRADDTQALAAVVRQLVNAAGTLGRQTKGLTDARRWLRWAASAIGSSMVVGIILGGTVPGVVDRAMPADWYWPEAAAADVMRTDGWTAGQRLLRATDERAWREERQASIMMTTNRSAISVCAARATKIRKVVPCIINLDPGIAS